ncbi:MAG: HAMP domain-containing sensor histidine kinase [Polyangiaceae bacterium]
MRGLLPRQLVQRVAWVTAAAIACSAACVALVSGALAERFAQRREQQQLTDAASVLAAELIEPGVDPQFIAADEARELRPTGIRSAVYRGSALFAGDRSIPVPTGEGCMVVPSLTVCARVGGPFFAVVARHKTQLSEQRRSLVVASLLAVVVTTLLGALVARRIALRLVAPLSRLTRALDGVPADAPEAAELGANEGVEEVDSLRGTLRATFARLGHALANSRRFAADAAHELRSPLTVIIGQLELGAKSLSGEAKESNEHARRTAASLATLVERLLILATPAAKLDLTEELELHGIADAALDLIPVAFWSRVSVRAESDSETHVRGDRALLASMLSNAIENALKFSTGSVKVLLRATEHQAEIAVSDDGPGIPEADRERVFEPFFRTRATRASGTRGHGIGLALIAHVCAVHGGTARFVPKPRGSHLVIELPRS